MADDFDPVDADGRHRVTYVDDRDDTRCMNVSRDVAQPLKQRMRKSNSSQTR